MLPFVSACANAIAAFSIHTIVNNKFLILVVL
jgi:hypothetical protein